MLPRRLPGECIRRFSTTPRVASNIGRLPISIPSTVTLTITPPPPPKRTKYLRPTPRHIPLGGPEVVEPDHYTVTVKGPLGSVDVLVPPYVSLVPAWTVDPRMAARIAAIEQHGKVAEEKTHLAVTVANRETKEQRQMWGTIRSLLHNSIEGVTKGHQTTLTLKGVGYRGALVENGKVLELKVGFNHNVNAGIPEEIEVVMTNPTLFEVKSIDKEKLGLFCARVRRIRPPEPYKGKVLLYIYAANIQGHICWKRNYQIKGGEEEVIQFIEGIANIPNISRENFCISEVMEFVLEIRLGGSSI
jgi:large subunit ribosomal protein L6